MALVAVVPEEPAPKVMAVPSTVIFSFAPSANPETVNVKALMFWLASPGFTVVVLNTVTAAACEPALEDSVKLE